MSLTFLFWFFILLWVIGGFWWGRSLAPDDRFRFGGTHFIALILFLIVGWRVFGPPLADDPRGTPAVIVR